MRILVAVTIGLLPLFLRKPPIKDWLLVYFFNAISNGFIDQIIAKQKIVKYPVRLLPKLFKKHIVFDYLVYPTITIFYNQVTSKDKPITIFYKLLFFSIPMLFVELWAAKKTDLVDWKKGWAWYHTLISITIKSSVTRLFIGLVRAIDKKQMINQYAANQ
ncbi:CBO0543 family protein [Bacillus suaedae]|uniref:CBO0543 family protein n=1 Tax=Halalkalibacter suaedae TaxID=2822140 RepID=UPI001FF0BC68|nr:CBO0543 family protein [Bacillus suaedae]